MQTVSLHTLKPNVTRQDAQRAFSVGLSARAWRMRSGPLQRIAEAYVPYRGYRVNYNMAGQEQSRFFALDTVTGSLDLFEFPRAPEGGQLLGVQTRNYLPSRFPPPRPRIYCAKKLYAPFFCRVSLNCAAVR